MTPPVISQPELVTRTFTTADVTGDVTARPALVDPLLALLRAHGTLYDWAAEVPQPRALRGRAPVFVATIPDRDDVVVVRHAWHGGLLAPLTGDLFRMPTRAPNELMQSWTLCALGIPTSEVLGYARYEALPGLRRVDVVTRFIPNAFDLGMVAAGLAPHIEPDAALRATRELLVKMAAHGVLHPDLNVKNVLLRSRNRGGLEAMVIDVDVVRWNPTRPPIETMRANTARLLRSMRKWRVNFGCDLAEACMTAFEQEALAATPPLAATADSAAGHAIGSVTGSARTS